MQSLDLYSVKTVCHFIAVPLYMYAAISSSTCIPLCIPLWIFTLKLMALSLVLSLFYLNNTFIYKQNTIIAYSSCYTHV